MATKQFNASHTPSLIALKEEFFPHPQATTKKRHHSYCTDSGLYLEESDDFQCEFWARVRISGLLGIVVGPLALLFEILIPLFAVLDTVKLIRQPAHGYLPAVRSA